MNVMLLLSCVMVFLMFCCYHVNCCPYHCSCQGNIVHCNGLGLQMLQDDIPVTTEELDLHNNKIHVIEKHKLDRLPNLVKLVLRVNNISRIEPETFNGVTKLTLLDLEMNYISTLPRGIFKHLTELQSLKLEYNSLTTLDGVLDGLINLQKLTLQRNLVQQLENGIFRDLVKVEHIRLSENNISHVDIDTFSNTTKLTMLEINQNPLGNFDNILKNKLQLNYLDLTNCSLTSFPTEIPWTVRYMKVSQNHFTKISRSDLAQLQFLAIVVLESCHITEIENGAFSHMGFLTDIFLIKNNLTEVKGPLPHSVKNVYLDENEIEHLYHTSFQHGTSLTTLSLRNNKITSVVDAFQNITLKTISELHLDRNPLKSLENDSFVTMTSLLHLRMNRLNLQLIEADVFRGLDKLGILHMAFINVGEKRIEGDIFKHLPNIKELNLQESPNLARNFLNNIKFFGSLETLYLHDNDLVTLPSELMTLLPKLRLIQLSGNRFHCNSDLIWLQEWMKSEISKFKIPYAVHCYQPEILKGKSIIKIDTAKFNMTEVTTPFQRYESTTSDWTDMYDYYENVTYPDFDDSSISYNQTERPQFTTTAVPYETQTYVNKMVTIETNDTETTTMAMDKTTFKGHNVQPNGNQPNSEGSTMNAVGIGIGACIAVIVIMLALAALFFYLWQKRHNVVHHRARQYQQKNDYVFIISNKDATPDGRQRRLTREERGSTTSKASEDITNDADASMKVFTWDDE